MAELDAGDAKRRDALFERARSLIRSDPEAFTEAGRKVAELFPAERAIEPGHPDHAERGCIRRFGLFTRIDFARQAACDPAGALVESGGWFDFDANAPNDERAFSARMVILAILLGADPQASEVVTPEVCELGALPWDTGSSTELGRGWVDWHERDWPHGNEPSPRVLDRLDRAMDLLDRASVPHAEPAPSNGSGPVDYDCTKPGLNRVDEARRATHDLCRLAESFGGIAQRRADAQHDPVAERNRIMVELRDYARVVYGQWEPALVRVRRAIQAIRSAASGWGIELGPADDAINALRVAFDKPLVLTHGEQPGDHLFRPMNALGLGYPRDTGPRLNFDGLALAVGAVADLSNALRGIDEAGLDGGQTGGAGVQRKRRPNRTDADKAKDALAIAGYLIDQPNATRDQIARALRIAPGHVSGSGAWKSHTRQRVEARAQNRARAAGGVGDPSVGRYGE